MQDYVLYIVFAIFLIFIGYRKISFSLNKNIKHLSSEEVFKFIQKNKDLTILDVRTKQEFASGHIPGSKSFPVGEIASRINELTKYKDKPILVYCASGSRSPSAVRILLKNSFSNLYHMKRGLRDWHQSLK
ncbi:MAG: sulfurtransferase [Gracilibacter sp. BRH_c7a]|nr:MAG: sulfurtransferase [Gracilibacter sp. BRH_c7a]